MTIKNLFWVILTAILNPITLINFFGDNYHYEYNFGFAISTILVLIFLLFSQYATVYLYAKYCWKKEINWDFFYKNKYTFNYKKIGIFSLLGIVFFHSFDGEFSLLLEVLYGLTCFVIYGIHYISFYKTLIKEIRGN